MLLSEKNATVNVIEEIETDDKGIKENKKSPLIKVNTSKSNSNYDVIRMCLDELGWQDCPNGPPSNGCDIIWQSCASSSGGDTNEPIANDFSYAKYTIINKFPCIFFIFSNIWAPEFVNMEFFNFSFRF